MTTSPRPGRSRWLRWLLAVLLTIEHDQRVRLLMTCLAILLMLCCIGAMYLAVAAGLAPALAVHVWALVCCLCALLIYGLIRSGYSQRWRDPSLTLAQNQLALLCTSVGFVIAGPARGILLPMLSVIFMFGIFGMTPRQMRKVLITGLLLFLLATGWIQAGYSGERQPPALALAYLLTIVMVMLSSTFLGLRIRAVREKLRRQKADLTRALAQIGELAARDELTGLPNRRQMGQLLQQQWQRVQRGNASILLAQLDLDYFKILNDTHGHAAGDQALRAFADIASASLRAGDTLGRWGGEEFVLLLPDAQPAEAVCLLQRLQERVWAWQMTLPTGPVRLTFSVGIARLHPQETVDQLLQRADEALYQAKRDGRNCIAWAGGDAP